MTFGAADLQFPIPTPHKIRTQAIETVQISCVCKKNRCGRCRLAKTKQNLSVLLTGIAERVAPFRSPATPSCTGPARANTPYTIISANYYDFCDQMLTAVNCHTAAMLAQASDWVQWCQRQRTKYETTVHSNYWQFQRLHGTKYGGCHNKNWRFWVYSLAENVICFNSLWNSLV